MYYHYTFDGIGEKKKVLRLLAINWHLLLSVRKPKIRNHKLIINIWIQSKELSLTWSRSSLFIKPISFQSHLIFCWWWFFLLFHLSLNYGCVRARFICSGPVFCPVHDYHTFAHAVYAIWIVCHERIHIHTRIHSRTDMDTQRDKQILSNAKLKRSTKMLTKEYEPMLNIAHIYTFFLYSSSHTRTQSDHITWPNFTPKCFTIYLVTIYLMRYNTRYYSRTFFSALNYGYCEQ